jgi:hypothetical protein
MNPNNPRPVSRPGMRQVSKAQAANCAVAFWSAALRCLFVMSDALRSGVLKRRVALAIRYARRPS